MICNMGLLDRQVLAGEFFPAQLEDGPFGFFPAGEDGAETSWQNAGRRIVLRQGPGPQFALADKNVLAILRFGAEQIQDPLQIAAMSAVDIRLELPREVEAAGIDAKGHAGSCVDSPVSLWSHGRLTLGPAFAHRDSVQGR